MIYTYIWVTVAVISLLGLLSIRLATSLKITEDFPLNTREMMQNQALQQAHIYAQALSIRNATTLDAHDTEQYSRFFLPPEMQNVSDTLQPLSDKTSFVIFISSDGTIVATSSPQHYPLKSSISATLPSQLRFIQKILAGKAPHSVATNAREQISYAAVPVWNQDHQLIGAVYVQKSWNSLLSPIRERIIFCMFLSTFLFFFTVILAIPFIGIFFGFKTTQGIIKRVNSLIKVTDHVSRGNYNQQVSISRLDELGQLEQQFNHMAQQLEKSIEEQQKLARHNARLEERARISRELHDEILQDLFSLRILVDGLYRIQEEKKLPEHIAVIEQTIVHMTREIRALLLDLQPVCLEAGGLSPALKNLADLYRRKLDCTITTSIEELQLSPEIEHMLLRVAQEAIANSVRHADASLLSLKLEKQYNIILLTIWDNGKGFNYDEALYKGFGLRHMRERVQKLNGDLYIESTTAGTRIQVTILTGAEK
uniref:histidine kinase n=1 Tax=Thermosporothrix sp. COM3 TaxID=2490863 RepID=A0A455SL42_9CHLR|nr:hypothetical protein KTC_28390 [Thermosporothrix sp. COM3]